MSHGEKAALQMLRHVLDERGVVWRPPPGESEDACLCRFLRARGHKAAKAADFLAADMAWRAQLRVDERRDESAASILGGEEAEAALQAVLPHCCRGADRVGRPIIYKHFGAQCEVHKLTKLTSIERVCDYNWWINEQYVKALAAHGASMWVIIVDARGWHPGLFDTAAYRFLRSMAAVDADHYPERLASITEFLWQKRCIAEAMMLRLTTCMYGVVQ